MNGSIEHDWIKENECPRCGREIRYRFLTPEMAERIAEDMLDWPKLLGAGGAWPTVQEVAERILRVAGGAQKGESDGRCT